MRKFIAPKLPTYKQRGKNVRERFFNKISNEICFLFQIKEIGSLPSDAHGTYDKMSLKQLDKKLTECMNELKKYENVNKKACEQFMRASSQKEELNNRVEDLQKNEQVFLFYLFNLIILIHRPSKTS